MPLTYERRDYSIRLTAEGSDAIVTVTTLGEILSRKRIPREIIDSACASPEPELPPELKKAALSKIPKDHLGREEWSPPEKPVKIGRLTVETGVREWSVLPWESTLPPRSVIVRTTRVRPRVLQIPITFPIRVLELGGSRPLVPDAMWETFRGTSRTLAYLDAHTTLARAVPFAKRKKWATVEVLHVHDLPAGPELLANRLDSEPGTAGWLLRFADRFQTRLIVLDGHASVPAVYRRLAQAIVDRGGPAVLLLGAHPEQNATLYGDISHDRPLDWIRGHLQKGELFAGDGGEESLRYSVIEKELANRRVASRVRKAYKAQIQPRRRPAHRRPQKARKKAGGGGGGFGGPRKPVTHNRAIAVAIRESAKGLEAFDGGKIRIDRLYGTRAERFGNAVAARLPGIGRVAPDLGSEFQRLYRGSRARVISIPDLARRVAKKSLSLDSVGGRDAARIFSAKLGGISKSRYEYHDHESEGMLPLAAKVADVKSFVDATRAAKEAPEGPRHVNSAFYTAGSDGRLEKIRQANARLRAGEVVHLGVQIGPKDKVIVTVGPTAFLEEKIRWETEGAWIEIGVTGIDFDVAGDPVQQVYLHRREPTDLVTFAVAPRAKTTIPGVARLRFTIYHRNNIVQSFFVAAALESAEGDVVPRLARALNASGKETKKIGKAGYIARMEYSNIANVADAARATPRALTILANDNAGDKVTTLKADELFAVSHVNLKNEAGRARKALLSASRRGVAYRFDSDNVGPDDELCGILWPIAEAGWQIYSALVPNPNEQDDVRALVEKGGGIQAAHLDLTGAIPWAAVYDREVFYDKTLPVAEPAVCRASFPDRKTGVLPNVECGGAGCLLNGAANAARRSNGDPEYAEESVICPRRFWGYMFPIDVPVQKVQGKRSSDLAEEIKAGEPLSVVVGYNSNLDFAAKHVAQVTQNIVGKRSTAVVKPGTGRGPVWSLVKKSEPDIVYFYCHALAAVTTAPGKEESGPFLDFGLGHKGTIDDVLRPAEFGGKPVWSHLPLVFMNGCGTAGFDHEMAAKFIEKFIQAKGAAAVVGTETTIVERLAVEAAEMFLQDMLANQSAGDALLRLRRLLLAKNNPLGLLYTLYGSARLKLGTKIPI